MKPPIVVLGILLAALAQVTVAPLFPLVLAQADFLLVSLALATAFAGRRASMVSVPLIAVFAGFLSGRSVGLFVLAFLPFPPLAGFLAEATAPINRYGQTLAVTVVTGLWARTLLAMSVVAAGAAFDPVALGLSYLIPGIVLDTVLFSALYLPCRLFGLVPAELAPALARYRL